MSNDYQLFANAVRGAIASTVPKVTTEFRLLYIYVEIFVWPYMYALYFTPTWSLFHHCRKIATTLSSQVSMATRPSC